MGEHTGESDPVDGFSPISIHVPIGPVRGHLLLNGLLGVVLGPRAGLAILVGLLMQAALIGHGGYTTVGVTCCVMTIPALLAWLLFKRLHQLRSVWQGPLRALLVGGSVLIWVLSLAFCVAWLSANCSQRSSSFSRAWLRASLSQASAAGSDFSQAYAPL